MASLSKKLHCALRSSFLVLRESKANKKGFTLIELLIVIMVIGVLAGSVILLIDPVTQFQKGRDAQRASDMHQLQGALELYRAQYGGYPSVSSPDPDNSPFAAGCDGAWTANSDGTYVAGAGVNFLQSVPCDPQTHLATSYSYTTCGASFQNTNGVTFYPNYQLSVCLERDTSSDSKAITETVVAADSTKAPCGTDLGVCSNGLRVYYGNP